MRAPLEFGWISKRSTSPFVVIADADGNAIAQAIGRTVDEAMRNATSIIEGVNRTAGFTSAASTAPASTHVPKRGNPLRWWSLPELVTRVTTFF